MKLVVVDREKFKLYVWKKKILTANVDWEDRLGNFVVEKRYSIAVGDIGYRTPAGAYYVSSKDIDPDWRMPDSPWVAPEDRGKIIKGGDERNPLKGAFISLGGQPVDGVGIHGTADRKSIGTRASHGCIRMLEEDVLNLYDKVSIDTIVFIY
jgi:lipoprotein-anchoring transpeptidase ErfK/SrfK